MATETSRLLDATSGEHGTGGAAQDEGPPGFADRHPENEQKWSIPTAELSFLTGSHPLHDGQPRDAPMQLPAVSPPPRFGVMMRCGPIVGPTRNDRCLFLITHGFTMLVALPLPVAMVVQQELFHDPGLIHWHIGTVLCAAIVTVALWGTSLQDPGVSAISDEMRADAARMTREEFYSRYRWCRRCEQPMANDTAHCNSCKCCIRGLDHHCSFVGKCVGTRTKPWFNLFLFMLPVTWLYTTICAWQCGYDNLFIIYVSVLVAIVTVVAVVGSLFVCRCITCNFWGPTCTCAETYPTCFRVFGSCATCCESGQAVSIPGESCLKGRHADKNIEGVEWP